MPAEKPLVRRVIETGHSGAVIYLDADATNFWSVIKRHALNNLETLYGARYIYRAMGHDASTVDEVVPSINELGTFIWLHSLWRDTNSGYWHGAKLGWETIGQNRLRVVVSPYSDLLPNLEMAWDILYTIWKIYPESRKQLTGIDELVESWGYDKETRAQWRAQVERRKDLAAREAAYFAKKSENDKQTTKIGNENSSSNYVPEPDQVRSHYAPLVVGSKEWWTAVCGWYDARRLAGYRLSQAEFARAIGYSLSHTKREIGEWRAEHSDALPNDTE